MGREDKICARCGRRITWRKKWERNWESIRYCSAKCRVRRPQAIDEKLESTIVELLRTRGRGKTICPSEAARSVSPENWREQMERTREAARRLVAAGKLEITQRGRPVDPSTARGPIRLRLRDTPPP